MKGQIFAQTFGISIYSKICISKTSFAMGFKSEKDIDNKNSRVKLTSLYNHDERYSSSARLCYVNS